MGCCNGHELAEMRERTHTPRGGVLSQVCLGKLQRAKSFFFFLKENMQRKKSIGRGGQAGNPDLHRFMYQGGVGRGLVEPVTVQKFLFLSRVAKSLAKRFSSKPSARPGKLGKRPVPNFRRDLKNMRGGRFP